MVPACQKHTAEMGGQGGGAVHEGEKIHVCVGTGIVAVHQAGLGRSGDLREHGPQGRALAIVGVFILEVILQELADPGPKLIQGMGTAAAASFGTLAADQAGPLGRAQVGPGEGAVAVVQYVHIEQPPQGVLILHGDGLSFYRGGIGVQDQ